MKLLFLDIAPYYVYHLNMSYVVSRAWWRRSPISMVGSVVWNPFDNLSGERFNECFEFKRNENAMVVI